MMLKAAGTAWPLVTGHMDFIDLRIFYRLRKQCLPCVMLCFYTEKGTGVCGM